MPEIVLQQIEHFFTHYKDLEPGKWVKLGGWGDVDDAKAIILAGVERAKADEGRFPVHATPEKAGAAMARIRGRTTAARRARTGPSAAHPVAARARGFQRPGTHPTGDHKRVGEDK